MNFNDDYSYPTREKIAHGAPRRTSAWGERLHRLGPASHRRTALAEIFSWSKRPRLSASDYRGTFRTKYPASRLMLFENPGPGQRHVRTSAIQSQAGHHSNVRVGAAVPVAYGDLFQSFQNDGPNLEYVLGWEKSKKGQASDPATQKGRGRRNGRNHSGSVSNWERNPEQPAWPSERPASKAK